MRLYSRNRKQQRGATIVLLLAMVPLLLIPLIGLGIDGTRLYIVQSKLSAAVDGAALGAGRLLGTSANTTEIAGEFLNTNFPSGFWNTNSLQSNIQYSNNLGVQTINIYAFVNVPLTFARMLGQSGSLISASATATRKVSRVMIVLDRSGSMNTTDPVTGQNVFSVMKAGAQWFAGQFTPGYDEVGLVMYGGTSLVAYPETHPWINDPTATVGGPDTAFATNVQTQTGPIFDMLSAMVGGGGTGTEEALSQAYVEMQKAHNRDIKANNLDNTLNTIVLFTDGVPDAIPTYANDPNNTSVSAGSTCTNKTATAGTASTQMRGYIVASGCPSGTPKCSGWGQPYGLIRLASLDTTQSVTWWAGNGGVNDYTTGAPLSSLAGCAHLGSNGTPPWNSSGSYQSGNNATLADLSKIPTKDLYGNSTTGTAYSNSMLYDGSHYWQPNTTSYSPNNATDGYSVAAASWNATDAVGATIRNQTAMNPIQIFTIGYSGNGGTDTGLLNRLANTPQSTSYVASQPVGKFYLVNTTAQLMAAFDQVASSLLRLAQ